MEFRRWRPSRSASISIRWVFALLVAGWLLVEVSPLVAQSVPAVAEKPDEAQVSSWIRELSSLKFAEREAASNSLKLAGLAGIPELIKAAQGSNPEVTARAIECLSFLYESPDVAVAMAADDALEQFLKDGTPAAAHRTEQAFEFDLAVARRRNAMSAIQKLGGIFVPAMKQGELTLQEVEVNLLEPGSIQHAILGKHWHGDLSSLKYFERLYPELRTIYVTSNAPMTKADLEQFRTALLTKINVEPRGGFLGISGHPFDLNKCEVGGLAPNSPAKAAGLLEGDHLTHLNGIPIKGFVGLTTLLLDRKSGETVILDVLRYTGDRDLKLEELEISVTLGEWGETAPANGTQPEKVPIPVPGEEKAPKKTPEKVPDKAPEKVPDVPPEKSE